MVNSFAMLNQTACIVKIKGSLLPIGYYSVAIQIEDYLPNSTIPLSSVPVQFLVQTINIASTCFSP